MEILFIYLFYGNYGLLLFNVRGVLESAHEKYFSLMDRNKGTHPWKAMTISLEE